MARALVIDGQIFQTPAWHRGMGKYSLELLAALGNAKHEQWESIHVLLSKKITENSEIKTLLKEKLPDAHIEWLPLLPNNFRNPKIVEKNRKLVDTYLETKFSKNITIDFLVLSMMQKEIFPAFPSLPNANKYLLFYDLIPVMFYQTYLESSVQKAEYLPKIAELLKADAYFTISKTVANDLALYLGIDKSRIINIDGGPIDHSDQPRPISIPKPFILMPTGDDPRKNNRRGVLGFYEFNKLRGGKYNLVITSFFKDKEKQELSRLAQNLHFTGNVSGEELRYLYEECEALLFPSEYEGLGLPILEAVESQRPVACSNISVFQEMSDEAFHYFEPKSVLGIEQALSSAVASPEINEDLYQTILDKYKWTNTAARLIKATASPGSQAKGKVKPKLAVFGPDPTVGGQYGKLLQDLHAEIAQTYETTYFLSNKVDVAKQRANFLNFVAPVNKIADGFSFEKDQYAQTIYHVADTPACSEVLLTALAVPGILVLYDLKLDTVWQSLLDKKLISEQRYELETKINDKYAIDSTNLLTSLIHNQKHVVLFSEYQREVLMKYAKLIKSEVSIHLASMPLDNVVYPEAMPKKTLDIGEFYKGDLLSSNRRIITKTDAQRDEALSKMKTLIFDQGVTVYDVLAAMRFGIVCFVPEDSKFSELGDVVLKYKSVESARQDAQKLIQDEERYKAIVQKISAGISNYSGQKFMKQLQAIVEKG